MSTVKKDKRIVVSLDDCSSTSCYNIKKVKRASTSAAASSGIVGKDAPTSFVSVFFFDFVPSNFLERLVLKFNRFRFTRAGNYSLRLTLVPDSFVVQPTNGLISLSIVRGDVTANVGLTTSRDGYSPYVATIALRVDAGDIILFPATEGIHLYGLASGFVITKLDTQPGPSTLQKLLDAASKETDSKVGTDTTSKETDNTNTIPVAKPTETIKKPEETSKQTALNVKH